MAEVTSFGDAAALLNIGASFLCFGSAFGEAPNASVDLFQREVETTAGESETTEPAEPGPSSSSVGNLGSGAKSAGCTPRSLGCIQNACLRKLGLGSLKLRFGLLELSHGCGILFYRTLSLEFIGYELN